MIWVAAGLVVIWLVWRLVRRVIWTITIVGLLATVVCGWQVWHMGYVETAKHLWRFM